MITTWITTAWYSIKLKENAFVDTVYQVVHSITGLQFLSSDEENDDDYDPKDDLVLEEEVMGIYLEE